MGSKYKHPDWNSEVRVRPAARTVAMIFDQYGLQACRERWSWISAENIRRLAKEGRQVVAA